VRSMSLPVLLCTLASVSGCWQVLGFMAEHELESRTGPCHSAMVAVREELGRSRNLVHSEENGGVRVFVHEWHYPERGDTIVTFRWQENGVRCVVSRERVEPLPR
jgi:hypothetical protein